MGTRTLAQFREDLNPFIGGNDVGQDWVDRKINSAYDELVNAIEFAGVKDTHSFNSADGTASYSLPSDFMGMLAVVDTTNDRRLLRLELKDYHGKNPDSDVEGEPTHWSRDGSCVFLWPTPDDTYVMQLLYLAEPTHLSATTDATVIPATWDQAIFLLSAHYVLSSFAVNEEELTRAHTYFARYTAFVQSRKTDRDLDRQTSSRGLQVAWSEEDLIDQAT